jgi:hypothetical protein
MPGWLVREVVLLAVFKLKTMRPPRILDGSVDGLRGSIHGRYHRVRLGALHGADSRRESLLGSQTVFSESSDSWLILWSDSLKWIQRQRTEKSSFSWFCEVILYSDFKSLYWRIKYNYFQPQNHFTRELRSTALSNGPVVADGLHAAHKKPHGHSGCHPLFFNFPICASYFSLAG